VGEFCASMTYHPPPDQMSKNNRGEFWTSEQLAVRQPSDGFDHNWLWLAPRNAQFTAET
jgi:hypothetical protein